jgi:tRNA threonylcarbamoyl adenosine modification protein TsaD|eukprot:g6047.t1
MQTFSRGAGRFFDKNLSRCISRRGFTVAQTEGERLVLGIETSCDDTGIAVVNDRGEILAQALSSQWDVHQDYGGIVPILAAREHEKNFQCVFEEIELQLEGTGRDMGSIDAVAVTAGPGLAPCLRVGVERATALATDLSAPLVPINHLEAHALVSRVQAKERAEFPFLTLVVSGGHSILLVAKGIGEFHRLGTTLDDAAGEAFDKVARILGIGYGKTGGGPALEALAATGDEMSIPFPIPLQKRGKTDCNFSFSGLKTAVKYASEKLDLNDGQVKANVAASFQRVAVAHLKQRLANAVHACKDDAELQFQSIVVCGGVAANKYVRSNLKEAARALGKNIIFPAPELCTDNGVMVAWAGMERVMANDYTLPPIPEESILRQKQFAESSGRKGLAHFYPRWPL